MRVYAVISNNPDHHRILQDANYPWVLASFKATEDPRALPYRPGLLLDSGAFSVWSIGKTVDINAYIAWAGELRDTYGAEVQLINLDVIPGNPGTPPSASEKAYAIKASAENAQIIRAAGLPVVEVYHRFEPLDVLEQILDRRQPGEIISFGGLVGRSGGTRGKVEFCERSFSFLHDYCGGWDKLVPVHGLGVSGDAPLARRYPWWSVDSTTWITARNFNLHVNRSGRFVDRNRETAPRTTKDMVAIFTRRRLGLWLRYQRSLSVQWEKRGVRYLDHDVAA